MQLLMTLVIILQIVLSFQSSQLKVLSLFWPIVPDLVSHLMKSNHFLMIKIVFYLKKRSISSLKMLSCWFLETSRNPTFLLELICTLKQEARYAHS